MSLKGVGSGRRSSLAASPLAAAPSSRAALLAARRREGGRQVTDRAAQLDVSHTLTPPFRRDRTSAAFDTPKSAPAASKRSRGSAVAAAASEEADEAPEPALSSARGARGGRANDLRLSMGSSYSPPFSRAASRAPSAFNSPAGRADDLDESAGGMEMDFEFGGGGGGDDSDGYASPSNKASPARAAASGAIGPSPSRQKRKAPAASADAKKRKRNTLAMVEMAQRMGIVSEEKDGFGSGDEGDIAAGVVRPKRARLAPLDWWQNREQNYTRNTPDPLAHILPIVNAEQPVIKMSKSPAAKPPRAKPKRKPSSKPIVVSSDEEEEKSSARLAPIPPQMSLLNAEGVEKVLPTVAKHAHEIPLDSLDSSASDRSKTPHGGKAFEQHEFSSGILMLPPNTRKQREIANNHEIFYIISGPANHLQVTIHHTQLKLSKGDQFMIPFGNTYELFNTSNKEAIKMHFVLVKPGHTWVAEWARQQQAEKEAEEKGDEDEDEEDTAAARKAAAKKNKGGARTSPRK